VNLFVQEAAEQDLLRQVEWYAEQDAAVLDAIDTLRGMPEAGSPKRTGNPLRSWHVNGCDEFRVYYLAHPELMTVVRILHSKRDTGAILTREALE
jgi:plasmid stabilization system protein ParE